MKIKTKINFGDIVQDRTSDFIGIANGYATYDTGCSQFLVTPKCRDNDKKDSIWFDESRLKVIKDADIRESKLPKVGCDIPAPNKG